jgi:restriction system protein
MMRASRRQGSRKDLLRHILAMAVGVLGMAGALFAISFSLTSSPALQAVGKGFRAPVPYLALLGLALLVLYAVLRPAPEAGSRARNDPPLFGRDTTDFAPSLQREAAESASQAATHRGQRPPSNVWSARVFDDIEWRRFEALCASLFGQAGFETRSQSHGADGGVDIWLHSQHADGPAAVVQCKHWLGKPVGVKEVREFYGVMASHKLQRGTFATSSTFTADARQFAKDNGISALDGQGLLALISRRTPAQQESLLAIAYEGEYWRPTCASCGLKMVERSPKKGSTAFWGCAQFPKCRTTLPMRAA